jgi:predicted nucleic acid-binding protein
VIVVDTGAILSLLDADDRHHKVVRALFEAEGARWIVPWAVLPEVDYLARRELGPEAADAFVNDLAESRITTEWGDPADLERAAQLCARYRDLNFGLTDGVVMAIAERVEAEAIATLDLRDFGAVTLRGAPKLYPRDWKGER